ncbi:hypothetical protein EHS25_006292 [Saitozyma podzolica]|uniref:Uncharacterized protein n=1 Tax=Saitozyma podzolica TaxID=1890683 RepID=A0A427YRJ9_9TREE|nr:hypothetical protein EHS25_006292 [Saitozyma podzolica]
MSAASASSDVPASAPRMQDLTTITLLDDSRNETDIKTAFLLFGDRSETFQSIKFQAEFYDGEPGEYRALHFPIDMPELHILGDGQKLKTNGTIYHIVTAVPTDSLHWARLHQQEATLKFAKGTPTQWDDEWPNRTQLSVSDATLNDSQQPTWELSSRTGSGGIDVDSAPMTITETVRLVLEDPQFPQDLVPEDARPHQEDNAMQGAPETSDDDDFWADDESLDLDEGDPEGDEATT